MGSSHLRFTVRVWGVIAALLLAISSVCAQCRVVSKYSLWEDVPPKRRFASFASRVFHPGGRFSPRHLRFKQFRGCAHIYMEIQLIVLDRSEHKSQCQW